MLLESHNNPAASAVPTDSAVGLGTEFCSEKFRGIGSERLPLFRGRKCSFRGIPSSAEEPIPKLGTERNSVKK
jgi:hypothetical protein